MMMVMFLLILVSRSLVSPSEVFFSIPIYSSLDQH